MKSDQQKRVLLQENPETAIRLILEGTSGSTGSDFFKALVKSLAEVLGVHGAWVTEWIAESRRLRSHAFWLGDQWIDEYEYPIAGTPCEPVINEVRLVCIPQKVTELFPDDPDLLKFKAISYMGMPLLNSQDEISGHLAVFDTSPLSPDSSLEYVFRIFAVRAAAEIQRIQAEAQTQTREQQLSGLVNGAMDAILELDNKLQITMVNPATEKLFGISADRLLELSLTALLSTDSVLQLQYNMEHSAKNNESFRFTGEWIGCDPQGNMIPLEVSLSQYNLGRSVKYIAILRDTRERLEAERRIQALNAETTYLREELGLSSGENALIGESPVMLPILRDINEVAATDATVLLLGETGTGKEVVARTLHKASKRANAPLVTINCAAIPGTLIESELFGHEKGAFTGATAKREGRFALADGGTIFLDEIGEMPLELQAKLLRVLQEGEFEPVGGTKTCKTDVRVLAATHRDLRNEVSAGRFRDDLYYRISVFPITLPPLRERGHDIILLAQYFVSKISGKYGRKCLPISSYEARLLESYTWPGNVRELQNIIERAVITSQTGRLNLARALPEIATELNNLNTTEADDKALAHQHSILTESELRELERSNLLKALESTNWKISGENGTANLLGIKPTTLISRIKALGICRPATT